MKFNLKCVIPCQTFAILSKPSGTLLQLSHNFSTLPSGGCTCNFVGNDVPKATVFFIAFDASISRRICRWS